MHENSLKNLRPKPWKPGESGNPAGRPPRARLTEAFISDVVASWSRHGADILETMARRDPVRFASLARNGSTRAHMAVIASRKRPNARIRTAVRRAFILSDGQSITGRMVLERAFPRLKRFKHWHRWSARRALLQVAVVVGRNRFGRGRPNLWALKSAT